VPNELTIALWVRPDSLLSKSYFVNAFNRVYLYTQASDQKVSFVYKVGPSASVADNIEPIYMTSPSNI